MLRQHTDAPKPDPATVRIAVDAAQGRAQLLRRTLRAPAADEEDFRQDLLLDLVMRSDRFDSSRGTWPAFVRSLSRNAAGRIARNHIRIASYTRPFEPGHDPVDDRYPVGAPALKIDLERALQTLPAQLQALASCIADSGDVVSARRVAPLSQAGFYRALQKLRLELADEFAPPRKSSKRNPQPARSAA